MVQLVHVVIDLRVQWFNWLKGSISSRVQLVQLVQGFNWFIGSKGAIGFKGWRVPLVEGINRVKV